MKISVRANEIADSENKIKGLSTVSFGDDFKIRGVSVVEGKEGKHFVSMPSFKTNQVDQDGNAVFKDLCNPIESEFSKKLQSAILESFDTKKEVSFDLDTGKEQPSFSVKAFPFEESDRATKGLAKVYIDDVFVVNNVAIMENKNKDLFISMPSYKMKTPDKDGKPQYKEFAFPATKECRESLYGEIMNKFNEAKANSLSAPKLNPDEIPFDDKKESTKAALKECKEIADEKNNKKEPQKSKSKSKDEIGA